jgi:hypothetical protein
MPSKTTPIDRAAINRANSQRSCGPRTAEGKQRSSLNALHHGLTAASPVLPSEDAAAYQAHCRQFLDEHQPATATEKQLVQELADTAWRLNRIPLLEADVLNRAANPPTEQAAIDFDIVDAHRLLSNLGIQSNRLSRQFQKALAALREIQTDRLERERRELKAAAGILEFHKHKGLPWEPSDDGFVFSTEQVECFSRRAIHRNQARTVEYLSFDGQPCR